MFGLGTWEIAIILILALLVLGPDKLPKVARTLGKGMREMRRAANDLRMNIELDDDDVRPRPVDPDPAAPPANVAPVHPADSPQIAGTRIDANELSPNRNPIEAARPPLETSDSRVGHSGHSGETDVAAPDDGEAQS